MSVAAVNRSAMNNAITEQITSDTLYHELEKGVISVKKGNVYTIDEAWEEIDKT